MTDLVSKMAYAKADGMPWHGKGKALEGPIDGERMIVAAGLQFEVEQVALQDELGQTAETYALRRTDTKKHLGYAGKGYELFQPAEMFSFLNSLVQDGAADYATAGLLKSYRRTPAGLVQTSVGTRGFVTLRLNEDWTVGDDLHKTFIFMDNGWDGASAMHIAAVDGRVVCDNTRRIAIMEGSENGTGVKFTHTKNLMQRVEAAKEVLRITTDAQRRMQQWLQRSLDTKVERAETLALAETLFGDAEKAETPRAKANIVKAKREFCATYVTQEFARTGATAYTLFNAVTGYADHGLSYKGDADKVADARLMSTIGGRADALKTVGVKFLEPLVGMKMGG